MDAALFALQRLTAMIMAPFVLVHLGVIVFAVRDGLTVAEIMSRTQGNWFWIIFYLLFVISAAVHVPIGFRNIIIEWGRVGRNVATMISAVFSLILLFLGVRAVAAVGGLWS